MLLSEKQDGLLRDLQIHSALWLKWLPPGHRLEVPWGG